MKVWDLNSQIDFLQISVEARANIHQGVLSSNLFGYHWGHALSVFLVTGAPPYFDVLRTYLVLIATFPLMWVGLCRAPRMTMAASLLLWALAHGPHGIAFRDTIDGQIWFFNPFAWQLIFLSGAGLRIIMEHRLTLPSLPAVTALSLLVIALGLAWQLSGVNISHLPMFKTNLSPVRMLNALAIVYLALSREWAPWLMASPAINAARIVGRNSLTVYVAGTLISLTVDMADVQLNAGLATQTFLVSVGLLAAIGVAYLAERSRSRRRVGHSTTSARLA